MKGENKEPANSANCLRAKAEKARENLQFNNTPTAALCQQSPPPADPDKSPTHRQRLQRFAVWMAVAGILPIPVAEWLIRKWGLTDA